MTQSSTFTLSAKSSMPEDLALIFAYHFPPDTAIGGARPFRFYKYLSRLGFKCHVITAANLGQMPELNGDYVDDPFVSNPRAGIGWQIERGIRKLLLPGITGSQWSVHAYRAGIRFLKEHKQHRITIFSTFPPMGAHFAAYWLARRTRLPWIADFRDPIVGNPGHMEINRFTEFLYRKIEGIFVRSADCVIANTDSAETKLKTTYPDRANRIQLIWNGFDPQQRLGALPVQVRDRKVIAHVGELYGGRDVTPILQSLSRLIAAGKLSARHFQVHLAGHIAITSVPNPEVAAPAERDGWLKLEDERLPQKEAHRIIQTADGLFLIQPHTALQVPGKLFEYIQIGRPILAFVPPDSPVERILERSGVPYQCVYFPSTDEEMDESLLKFFGLLGTESKPNDWFEAEFNAELHAQKLARVMRSLARK